MYHFCLTQELGWGMLIYRAHFTQSGLYRVLPCWTTLVSSPGTV
jgi:hypothetical protein